MAQIIYALEYADDNGDSVHRTTRLFASLDGLMNGIEHLIQMIKEDMSAEDDHLSDTEDDDPPSYAKDLFYYTHHESMKNVPIPTREYIESVLNHKRRQHLNGLVIKVGNRLGGAGGFACEISVQKKTLNP